MKKNFFILEILLILILVSWPRTASAYLDPGTGSYIIQVILAAIFGSIFAIKMYYYQIKNFFKKLFSKNQKDSKDEPKTK